MQINGIDELIKTVSGLGGNVVKGAYNGMKKAVKIVQSDAKQGCPVDTGLLRTSIVSDVQEASGVIVGEVGTSVEYAPYVEFGTGKNGEMSDISDAEELGENPSYHQDWKGQPAQPFLYPALNQNKDNIKQAIVNGVTEQALKRGG